MKRVNILQIPIDTVTYGVVLSQIENFIHSGTTHQVITVNPEIILHSLQNAKMKEALLNSALNTPDGTGIIWASKFLKIKNNESIIKNITLFLATALAVVFNKKWLYSELHERVTGVDLMEKIAQRAGEKKWRIFLLGAKDPEVAQKTAHILKNKYHLDDIGFSNLDPDHPDTVSAVRSFEPDILFVAYGSPKQEIFIYKNLKDLNAKVAIGVGGSFEFTAGIQKRSPAILQKLGLEWLWRIVLQPSRIIRIYRAVVVFPLKALFAK